MANVFLTARWERLFLLTFAVEPAVLLPYLPKGLVLDTLDGKAFLSFVAFDFLDTRLKGVPIPFHTDFPEINLRFYVRKGEKRGVAFIREFVPKFWIAQTARTIYNEPYRKIYMKSNYKVQKNILEVQHFFSDFELKVWAENETFVPKTDSLEHFFKEHDCGFGTNHRGQTLEYAVEHPVWEVYKNVNYELKLDFGKLYGAEWEFLNRAEVFSKVLAKGSEIKVFEAVI